MRYAEYVVSGMGQDDTVDGMTKIKRFKKEAFPQILVSVNMLDTGFDCPEVVNLLFARFTKSTILYQQMRGRGTRKAKGKPVFTMFDFVGVPDFHGDDAPTGEGGIVVERPKRPPGPQRKLLSLDINDHIDPTTRAWVTIDEDGNMIFPGGSEAKSAAVGARFEAWFLAREEALSPEAERWLRMVGSQLKANADVWDEFTPGHFAFPPFTLMGGMAKAPRVFGGAGPLDDLLDSLNEAVFPQDDAEGGNASPDQPTLTQ